MKNKQVKQMMRDTYKGQWFLIGGNSRYIKNFGVRFFEFGVTAPMDATISIPAK